MMEQTDKEMWQSFISGNTSAFGALFQKHKGKVFNFALRLTASRADAEDITSEVFIQLFNKRFQDDGRAQLSTWLFTVARNASLSRIRSAQYVVSMWFKDDAGGGYKEWDIPDDSSLPGAELGKRETAKLVRKALHKLPLEQKEALILREYFQKDYATIAEILGCSLEKVKVLIFRGREALRAELAPVIKEEGK